MAPAEHHLFFASRIENGRVFLDNEESRHAVSVLRFSAGEIIQVADGKGVVYECRISTRSSDTLSGEIISTKQVPKPQCAVRMFIGLCDRDKFEDLTENLSALGADLIVPLVCQYAQKPWWNVWDKHAPRIHKKLVAGIKQSRNPWLPQLAEPTAFGDALSKTEPSLVIAAEAGRTRFVDVIGKIKQATAVSCFVGPPGGFSPDELERLKTEGALFLSLSENRLRTELAAVMVCGAVTMITTIQNFPF
jgi:16S rRNA (uracil1498-N3)-methyltransferase